MVAFLRIGALLGTLLVAAAASGQSEPITLELNRLQPIAGGCRMHVVVANGSNRAYDGYQLDLVIFGDDGVIARRTVLDVAPLRARKTSVYAFDVTDLACDRFGRVLLNDIAGCAAGGENVADCVVDVGLSSRVGVDFVK